MLAIQKIGDLWGLPRGTLHSIFGLGGDDIYLHSRGIDSRPIVTSTVPKSVSRETTFSRTLGQAPPPGPPGLSLRPA